MPDFLLPDLGEGLEQAEIVAWHVAPGDTVHVDQVVVEVETAKATVEVPVPFDGVVAQLHASPGASVPVGAPLITVAPAGAAATTPAPAGSGNVLIGYGTSDEPIRRRRNRRDRAAAGSPDAAQPGPVPVISPLVRRLARDGGLDLHGVRGTGPNGVVLRCNVEAALSAAAPSASDSPVGPAGTRIPLRGVRKAAADLVTRSRREIPEATVWVDVDVTDLLSARAALNAANPQAPVGVLAMVARFAVLGLRRYPELNGRVEPDAIVVPDHVNLGIAAQTDRGLVVPVVAGAQAMTTRQLADSITAITAEARAGTLAPARLSGGTFTVNNYGVFGVDGSAAVINHPEVAILGIGRIVDRPWVVAGELAVRKVAQLTLAFDHRACDGGTAGGFLRYVADCVESPVTALGDL